MIYREEYGDLFELSNDYAFCQCISADFAMGAGIAVEFNRHFNTKKHLIAAYGYAGGNCVAEYKENQQKFDREGLCLIDVDENDANHNIINFVTKAHYWEKPTYKSLTDALLDFKDRLPDNTEGIKLAMPKIGCGIDGLDWSTVKELIKYIFSDTDLEIVVRYL